MEIKLDNRYLIKTDKYNFKVGYYIERERNGEVEKVFVTDGYYSNLSGAIKGYIKGEILSIDKDTNKEIFEDLKKIYLRVKEIYLLIDESKDIHISELRRCIKNLED
jgi:hypothetical protein